MTLSNQIFCPMNNKKEKTKNKTKKVEKRQKRFSKTLLNNFKNQIESEFATGNLKSIGRSNVIVGKGKISTDRGTLEVLEKNGQMYEENGELFIKADGVGCTFDVYGSKIEITKNGEVKLTGGFSLDFTNDDSLITLNGGLNLNIGSSLNFKRDHFIKLNGTPIRIFYKEKEIKSIKEMVCTNKSQTTHNKF